jgi:uncharacterized Tic20 family protein
MINVGSVLLGILNIAIVVAVWLLIGALIVWLVGAFKGPPIDDQMRNMFLLLVLLIAIYMLVALVFGLPTIRVIGFRIVADTAVALLSATATADM